MADEDKGTRSADAEPKTAAEWLALGRRYTKELRLADAVGAHEHATVLEPNNALAWDSLARAQSNLRRFAAALVSYDKALALSPQNANIWAALGATYRIMGRYEDAITACDKSLALDPRLAKAWYERGVTLEKQGKLDEGLRHLQEALRLGYNAYACLIAIGDIYDRQHLYPQALETYDEARAQAPSPTPYQADIWYRYAVTLLNLGRSEEALAAIDHAIELRPYDHFCWVAKVRILCSLHRWGDTLRALPQVVKTAEYAQNPHGGVVRE